MKSLFYKVSGSPSLLGLNVNLSNDLPNEFLAMPISFQVTLQSLFPLIKLLATSAHIWSRIISGCFAKVIALSRRSSFLSCMT